MNKEIDKALIRFADEVVLASKRELGTRRIGKNKNYGVATRALQKSLVYKFRYRKGEVRGIQLYAKGKPGQYAAYIHFGVNGKLKRRGSPFSYGEKMPPPKVIKSWMKAKPVRLRNSKGSFVSQKPYTSKRTGKKVDPLDSPAFLIARSIQRNGIPGLYFFERGYANAWKKQEKILSKDIAEAASKEITARFKNLTLRPNV